MIIKEKYSNYLFNCKGIICWYLEKKETNTFLILLSIENSKYILIHIQDLNFFDLDFKNDTIDDKLINWTCLKYKDTLFIDINSKQKIKNKKRIKNKASILVLESNNYSDYNICNEQENSNDFQLFKQFQKNNKSQLEEMKSYIQI